MLRLFILRNAPRAGETSKAASGSAPVWTALAPAAQAAFSALVAAVVSAAVVCGAAWTVWSMALASAEADGRPAEPAAAEHAWSAESAASAPDLSAGPAAADRPAEQVARLAALADGAIASENRLWVVTARTPDGLLRFSSEQPEEAARWIERQEAALSGVRAAWFVQVQGDAAADGPEALWSHVESAAAGAVLLESYSDGNTHSRAYDAPGFMPLAGYSVSLQAAAHLHTEIGRWRITLGTPAILTEF